VKESPILMTPENAQKCHVGTKTQTRRIVKEHPPYLYVEPDYDERGAVVLSVDRETGSYAEYSPYGVVGDTLWVREAWADLRGKGFGVPCAYKGIEDAESKRCREENGIKWRPAIHMPRWACRTVLEITEIRVERLQDITEKDAQAEGCHSIAKWHDTFSGWHLEEKGFNAERDRYRAAFFLLWESINGPGSWDANPFVWALTFKKVEP